MPGNHSPRIALFKFAVNPLGNLAGTEHSGSLVFFSELIFPAASMTAVRTEHAPAVINIKMLYLQIINTFSHIPDIGIPVRFRIAADKNIFPFRTVGRDQCPDHRRSFAPVMSVPGKSRIVGRSRKPRKIMEHLQFSPEGICLEFLIIILVCKSCIRHIVTGLPRKP